MQATAFLTTRRSVTTYTVIVTGFRLQWHRRRFKLRDRRPGWWLTLVTSSESYRSSWTSSITDALSGLETHLEHTSQEYPDSLKSKTFPRLRTLLGGLLSPSQSIGVSSAKSKSGKRQRRSPRTAAWRGDN